MKYSIVTFGCRVNQADSLRIEETLRAAGGTDAPSALADLVVVNTCSVTASADQGARQTIRRIARENPQAQIVVTGCYASRRPDDVATLPNVVCIIHNEDKDRFADAITTAVRFGDGDGACGAAIEPGTAGRTAFTLRVQTGCEEQCSYCIIPSTRGRQRSLPIAHVLTEIQRIASAGFKEIALTGVHLGSFGRDLHPAASLVELLAAIDQLPVDVTFRISSLEPMDCVPEIIDLVASSGGRFAPHFHLPLQHASDRMLALMQRPYSLEYYRQLVERLVERLPHASVGTDLIVGFPGETDADFQCDLEYLPFSGLSHLHVFPYSDRPGTAASQLTGKVPGLMVRERGLQLRAIGAQLSRQFLESQADSVRWGLTLEGGTTVLTDNYLKLRIAPGRSRNERVRVLVGEDSQAIVLDG
jgi:threonylcarbamoyladenosine tRNA methylthiotransferase MtaB